MRFKLVGDISTARIYDAANAAVQSCRRLVRSIGYEVVKSLDRVEIRRYPQVIIARVDGYGDDGFNLLFRFISGENRQRAKVAMTAPVISEKIAMTTPVISTEGSIAFVMPESYTSETKPEPIDERVRIVEVPARILAALRFSGRWNRGIFAARSGELLAELRKAGVRSRGEVFSMRYNPPFTPWFMRRNEVAVEVEWEV